MRYSGARMPAPSVLTISLACCVAGALGCSAHAPPPTADAPAAAARLDGARPACDEPFPASPTPPSAPPYSGTVFLAPGLLTDADPSSLTSLTFTGQGLRQMFDRRTDGWVELNAYLFDARFGTATSVEVQVNPEFTQAEAEVEARFYATAVGRVPGFLFRDLRTMWIHKGLAPFGGGNNNLLIHTDQGREYVNGGYLEEVFLHEGTHTSLDGLHAASTRWLEAQAADGVAISTYARDNPTREDVAESMGPYLAQRVWADRLPAAEVATIRAAIPNRIAFFDCLQLTLAPPP